MIQLPFEYTALDNSKYKILGWRGSCLQTKDGGGREWLLRRTESLELLRSLGLKEEDVPGHINTYIPKKRGTFSDAIWE